MDAGVHFPAMNNIPDWFWQNVVSDSFMEAVLLLVWLVWKCRATFANWYYVASYQLSKPFRRDSFNESASITVRAVGTFKSVHDPYSGEWITVKRDSE